MKIDPSKHRYTWRIQKGCHVEWFHHSKKGRGVVMKVTTCDGSWGKEPSHVVVKNDDESVVTVSIDNVRIVKTPGVLRKEQFERQTYK